MVQQTFKTINIGGKTIEVEIADTAPLQKQGLAGRDNLSSARGMLFVYPDKKIRHFWMKNMRFPLDVIWLMAGEVVGWLENVPPYSPGGEIFRFQSPMPVDMVLEVNAGWIKKYGGKIFIHRQIDRHKG